MAVTQNNFTGDGSKVLFNFTFPYLAQTDVKVKLDGVDTTAYSFANATTVQMNSAPADGVKVIVYRNTDNDNKKATFYPGSAIKAEDLNNNIDQILYVAQEVDNNALSTLGTSSMQGNLQLGEDNTIVFEGATDNANETILTVTDPTADRTITLPDVTGTVVTTGDTGTVTSTMITDGTIVNDDINASAAIAQSKLNIANATTSAAGYQSAADKTKLDSIETGATADQTNAEIRAAVEAASDSNVFTDADHTKLNNIETAATADQTAAEIRTLVGDASNSNVFTDADNTKLAGIETAATADQTASEIKSLIASSPLDASHLAADSVTTSELADAELTTLAGMQSGTASILADSTALTSTTAELNQLDGKTLGETTLTTNSDTAIPTSKAVNDRILTVTNALGGFVAIANETSFPATHPDPSDGAGTVVSVSDAGGVVVNGSGVASITNGAGSGNTVTINGFPSSLYSKTLEAGIGIQVQTTTTLHTYDYHKILAKEADVEQLSSDINDFKARYRIASSAPASENDDGDLYYDTTAKKMKVYNGATSQWDDVAQSSSSYIVTLSEAFDSNRTSFTMSTAATDAQSTIVSINGVIQKPNAGTSQPSEGFAINGNQLVLAAAPPTNSTAFVVVLGDTVSIGTPSDNTVSTIKIQNVAVTTGKIEDNAVTVDKLANNAVVNDSVDASAAIAGSKINPAFTTAASITAAQPQLQFQDSDGTNQITEVSNSSGHTYIKTRNNTSGGNFYVNTWDNTNSNYPTLFTILNGGNVGIGETSPGSLLHVKESDTNIAPHASAQICLEREGTNYLQFLTAETGTSGVLFGDGSDVDVGKIVYDHNVPSMQFFTETAPALTIDSSQNVGIGTGNPTTPDGTNADNPNNGKVLSIYGDSPAINLIHNTTGGSAADDDYAAINFGRVGSSTNPYRAVIGYKQSDDLLRINANNSIVFDVGGDIGTGEAFRVIDGGHVIFKGVGDAANGSIEIESTDPFIRINDTNGVTDKKKWDIRAVGGSGSEQLAFRTVSDDNGTFLSKVKMWHNGNLEVTDGNVKIGTAGHGIDFHNYGSEEDPDDTVTDVTGNLLDDYEKGSWTPADASAAGLSFGNAHGRYTKIGNTVHAHGSVTFPTTSNTASFLITLPFTATTAGSGYTSGSGSVRYTTKAQVFTIHVRDGQSNFSAYTFGGTGMRNNDMSTDRFDFSCTYPV